MEMIVTLVPTNLVTNSFLPRFYSFVETKIRVIFLKSCL